VDVAAVLEQPLNVQLSLAAELTPYRSVDLHARVSGFVKTVSVDRGSRVRRGAVLAELEAPELVAQRAEAQSKLQAAEAQLSAVRSKADAEAGTLDKLKAAAATPGVVAGNDLVVAERALDASRSQVTSAQQLVEAARQAVNALHEMETYLRITAPFDGVVTERGVHPGALVGPASGAGSPPLLRMAEQDRLRLVVPVPEAYLASVAPGAELAFSVAAYPGQSFTGKVARAAQTVESTTRTMAVELDVTNTDGRLTPGTFCQVRWPVTRTRPSLMVPTGSIATTTDRVFVIRIRDGKAEWVDVTTGLTAGALIEVFGDLRAGELVAVRGTDELRNGSAVRPRDPKPAT
jgi:RND family efflux transporter MFP subunit